MSTALLSSFKYIYIMRKDIQKPHMHSIVLTNDVSPTDSQDDKMFPEHIKINPKTNPFSKNLI